MNTSRLLALLGALLVLSINLAAQSALPPAPPPRPPVNHEFDFWLGDWDVFAHGTEKNIGESHVESIAGGYGLLENWTANPVYGPQTGKSLNSYNPRTKQWQQYWVGSGGGTTEYKGGLDGGKMILLAESFTPKGAPFLNRGTWTPNPDGTVRQQFEISTDEGKTWQASFDGLYRRKAAAKTSP